ncbi:MAG: cell division protein FtsW [Bacteroidetes bacterium CG02_land_8_20_14_3_00_31_25]|nr:FtsW/RodA/SpoVE family cell cycle protein [Bacteroidota bacterium]PIV63246.1 MAG: cell division protein FtsW [Bacteroidetes bacterium CG02_land_8_20_14_3_00_31_25]
MKTITAKIFKGDAVIWGVIAMLSIFSILAVYSSTGTLAFKYQGGNTLYYLLRHGFLLLIGFAIIFITHKIPVIIYLKISQILLFISIPLLVWTLIRGTNLNEASRWLTIPGIGLSFQTSDLAKFSLIIFIARFLAKNQGHIKDFKTGFRSIIIWIIIVCGLILPANFSTAIMLFFTSLILLFLGRVKIQYLLYVIGIGIAGVAIFVIIAINLPEQKQGRVGTWKKRIENYFSGKSEENFQVEQSKIAIASGGFIGKGPGNSIQRNFLPHPYSDFIFAIIVEEYGVAGAFILIALYLVLLFRAGTIVRKSTSAFAAFLSMGLVISLIFQAFINMAVAVNLFPVTGQTLPLVSMGGTSIIFTCAAFGIILSISQNVIKKPEYERIKAES